MRVLWVSNILFDDVADALKLKRSVGGGWMQSLLQIVKADIDIGVVALSATSFSKVINGVQYYVISSVNEKTWKNILNDNKPDLIQLHGTEYPHTLQMQRLSTNIPCVASIQGLISIYARYSLGGMSNKDILRYMTLKDVLRKSGPWSIQRGQYKRGKSEQELIGNLKYVIGRTEWDYSHVLALNPSITYFKCNEAIRANFYEGEWNAGNMVPHTIFCCNSTVPLKGVHQLVKALVIVRKIFPNVKLRIVGKNILGKLSLKDWLRMSGYDRYLRTLIYKSGLENNVTFLGALNAESMKEEFLRTNVFVLPSAIENSPNSLAEAQLLGVPIVASYAGGVPDMMPYPLSDCLYRFEEIEMLAQKIITVFCQKEWHEYVSCVKKIARQRHDKEKIRTTMIAIYEGILKRERKDEIPN